MALHHAASGEVIDLRPLGSGLQDAHSSTLVKTDSFEAIRLVLKTGAELPAHQVSAKFTLHCLEGRVHIELAEGALELSADRWVYFDAGVPHAVRAVEDSSLLLTMMLPSMGNALARDADVHPSTADLNHETKS